VKDLEIHTRGYLLKMKDTGGPRMTGMEESSGTSRTRAIQATQRTARLFDQRGVTDVPVFM